MNIMVKMNTRTVLEQQLIAYDTLLSISSVCRAFEA